MRSEIRDFSKLQFFFHKLHELARPQSANARRARRGGGTRDTPCALPAPPSPVRRGSVSFAVAHERDSDVLRDVIREERRRFRRLAVA
jgi:hypothetical protein